MCKSTQIAQVEKRRPDLAFGKEFSGADGTLGQWTTSVKARQTSDQWAALFDSFVTFSDRRFEPPLVVYRSAGHGTCAEFTRQVHGIPEGTWLQGMAHARERPGWATLSRNLASVNNTRSGVDRLQAVTATAEAVDWWMDLMHEWDMMPNESPPIIKHPAYVAETLYKQVYVPEICLYGTRDPLSQKDGKAPGSWFSAREEAVKQLSLREFGLKDGATTAEPRLLFRLLERPDHSNFAECSDCRTNRVEKETNITNRVPRAARDATTAKQVAHIVECHAERNLAADWVREANRSRTLIAELDDKLGSWWNFLPMPPGGRFGKATANKWRYHQCLQANIFPGYGNFFSFVPPFLTTGNNFGCTCFCVSLFRLIKSGKLPPSVTHGARQTDGGSDNDGKTAHGVHYILVREGVFNDFLWGRLRSGHSHNRCDRHFAEAKTIFYPRSGVGPGCASPMQYHAALVDGLKQLPGGLEIMWQLANFDFDAFVSSFMDRSAFTHTQGERLWHYEYAPELTDVYVRCTFKTKLTDDATPTKAAWKPRLPANDSGWHATDPEGLIFLQKNEEGTYVQPDFDDPGLEKWKEADESETDDSGDNSGWSRDKVMRDIREYAKAEKFTPAQCEEWEALFDFHLQHESPESVPMAPHTLRTATTGHSVTMHGTPVSWSEMWTTLRRLPRAHLGTGEQQHEQQLTAVASQSVASSSSGITKGLALENSVTGTNYPKRDREKQGETYKMQVAVSQLPHSRSTVQLKQLYFVALPHFEGEFAVGVGRAVKESKGEVMIEWLQRRGWNESFLWSKSPMFDPYVLSRTAEKSSHPMCDILPVDVELTVKSKHLEDASLTDKRQRFCIVHECVVRLREYCSQIRPELKQEQPVEGKKRKS